MKPLGLVAAALCALSVTACATSTPSAVAPNPVLRNPVPVEIAGGGTTGGSSQALESSKLREDRKPVTQSVQAASIPTRASSGGGGRVHNPTPHGPR